MKTIAILIVLHTGIGCAPTLLQRCKDRSHEILDRAESGGDLDKAKAELNELNRRCDRALTSMAAVEEMLQ